MSETEIKVEESFMKKHGMSLGLAAAGSGLALVYGLTTSMRWWKVLLLMAGGSAIGRGVGYALESKQNVHSETAE